MINRITSENIDVLQHDECFVFGSNEMGFHGAGAAHTAELKFGAKHGQGFGPSGQSFAIPTKDWDIETLPLDKVQFYVDRFKEYVKANPNINFLVTKVGCGLAGYRPEDIAPLFRGLSQLENISFPEEFWNILSEKTELHGATQRVSHSL